METDRLVREAGKTFTTWRSWLSIKPSANLAGLLALPCKIAEFSSVPPHNEEEKTVDPDELSTTNTKLLNNYFWQMVTCGNSKQLCVELQLSQLSHLSPKKISSRTFIRTPLTGHLFLWDIWGWAAMAQRCHPRQCTLRIYLWERFWNGFLLGQTCEIPATARGNHFRPLYA